MDIATQLLTEHLDTWTATVHTKSSAGRGGGNKRELYGIKKLRELILELAVRGLLVPQDPNDEPASELLKRITSEKAQLIKDGMLKKQKKSAEITEDEMPFELPSNWMVSRLGDLSHLISKGTTPTSVGYQFESSGVSFIKIENIDRGRIKPSSISQFISEETNKALSRSQLEAGDLLFSIAGTIGKTAIVHPKDLPANTNQALAFIRGTNLAYSPSYLRIQLDSFVAEQTRMKARGGAMPNVSLGDLKVLVSPLPPLAEQQRIVAKVDELIALCDRLEQQQSDHMATHELLVKTLLDALVAAASDAEQWTAAWLRIAAHFDALFTTEASIDQLKQTILQLAVMGKLVEQDAEDEPASKLVKVGLAEKAKQIEEGKIKKQKELPPIDIDQIPFSLPGSWSWVRLSDVSFFQEGPGILAKDFRETGVPLIRISGMHGASVSLDGCNYLDKGMVDNKWPHFRLDLGDIVLSSSASLGKVSKVTKETVGCIVYTGLIRFKTYRSLFEGYLVKFFESAEFVRQINRSKTGAAIKHFGPTHLKGMLAPIPPLAEQHRIVAKVDELMALCDALKAKLDAAQATQRTLTDSLVEQAVG